MNWAKLEEYEKPPVRLEIVGMNDAPPYKLVITRGHEEVATFTLGREDLKQIAGLAFMSRKET